MGHQRKLGLAGGCGARAVSRKTPIYFIFFPKWSFLERCGPGWPDNERRPEEERNSCRFCFLFRHYRLLL